MNEPEALQPQRSVWQQGLLLALLVWLLSVTLHNQTFNSGKPYEMPVMLKFIHVGPKEWSETWFYASVAALVAAVAFMGKAADISLDDAAPLGAMLIVGFYNRPTGISFAQAQLNLPLLTLLCAAYLAERAGRPYRMGAALAAAAMIQPWMLAVMLYLLMRRQPLAFIWGVALFAAVLATLMISSGLKDPAYAIQFGMQSLHLDAQGFANQSILGFARVHFGPNRDAVPLLDDPIALHVAAGAGLAMIAGGLWLAFRQAPAAGSEQARLQLGLLVVSLLLALPVCERSWFVLLLPAIWTLLCSERMSAAVRAATVGVFLILTRTFPVPRHVPAGLASLQPSAYFLAALALWMILLVAIGQSGRRRVSPIVQFNL